MKRKIVLISLLVLPLTVYVYFSLAKHNSLFLPILTEKVNELPKGTTMDSAAVFLKDKITILGFLGNDVIKRKETIFNLNQKIYNKFGEFDDFQIVMLLPEGNEAKVNEAIRDLSIMADISKWKFLFTKPEAITKFHESLDVKQPLEADTGSYYVYIIDKELNLRGRDGVNKKGEKEYIDGYNTFSAAELHNEMTDDVKIVLREYRLALRKNDKNKREI